MTPVVTKTDFVVRDCNCSIAKVCCVVIVNNTTDTKRTEVVNKCEHYNAPFNKCEHVSA